MKYILLAIIAGLILLNVSTCSKKNRQINQVSSVLTETNKMLDSTRNKQGELSVTYESIVVDKARLLEHNSDLRTLLETAKGKPQRVIKVNQRIKVEKESRNVVYLPGDTIRLNTIDSIYIIPEADSAGVRVSSYSDEWFDYSVISKLDSTTLNISRLDLELSIVDTKRFRLFRPNQYRVLIKSSNPHVSGLSVQSYTVVPKRKWIVLSAGITYGYNFASGKLEPIIGVNLGVPIISF